MVAIVQHFKYISRKEAVMQRNHLFTIVAGTIAMVLVAWGTAAAGGHTQTLTGHIAAIDTNHSTVVVDAPVGDRQLTIGGPLAEDAQLRKDGRTADLNAFQVGDRVSVTWQRTDKGISIHRLVASN
jgi:hypothetical protein